MCMPLQTISNTRTTTAHGHRTSTSTQTRLSSRRLASRQASTLPQHRPMPARNNSASSLSRAALLRASRPHLARSLSATGGAQLDVGCENPFSQLAHDAPPSPVSLASPFIIQSEELDTEYFRF
ncbi:hypothetical protein NUW54_g13242 [Trametes sanguinea]|uniref:Uncharacterized protein n=1 Tax=Trametes sanguinea TaxID=158606 RepID=A0ACC1MNV2_9APHY|nr:hypothetical protein NUW54_g13242 [Trametes sanguinea]